MARTSTKTKNSLEKFLTELGFQRSETHEGKSCHYFRKIDDGRVYCIEYDLRTKHFRTAYHKNIEDYISHGFNKLKFSEWTFFDETVMMVDGVLLGGMGYNNPDAKPDIDTITDVENGNIINRIYGTSNQISYSIENLEKKDKTVYFLFNEEDTANEAVRIYRPNQYPQKKIAHFQMRAKSYMQIQQDIIVMDEGAYAMERGELTIGGNMFIVFPNLYVPVMNLINTITDDITPMKDMFIGKFILKTKLLAEDQIIFDIILK